MPIKLLVLDVLKPHEPNIVELSKTISNINGISGCNLAVFEIDKRVENVKLTIEGKNINYDRVREVIEKSGGTIHSIDEVAAGTKTVREVKTPQDRESKFLR
jgi:uncharacterized protein